ncbi:MAG: CehA/McbA family metallohydrolase [Verrucomicrobiota bacterium]
MKTITWFLAALLGGMASASAALPVLPVGDWQPFAAQVRRVLDALEVVGEPLSPSERSTLRSALEEGASGSAELASAKVQAVLDSRVLVAVQVNPEMRVKAVAGPAQPELVEAGWRTWLVKVHNEAGTTAELRASSPQAEKLFNSPAPTVGDRWLDLALFNQAPLRRELGGLPVEYRILQLYARDAGRREARMAFNVGQGTQDLGFRSEVDLLFQCVAAPVVRLGIQDETGRPATAALRITDHLGRVYPSPAKRLAPDFFFHPQVYRADGEELRLPAGKYQVEFRRGPESVPETRELEVAAQGTRWAFAVRRWIDPAAEGWISGDHHIHAAGCAHYTKPTEGVHAPDMMRHVLGEDLKVGANLTWGPCFDYQKQFFRGVDDPVSRFPYLLRYDIEVSGFGSHQSGHLCLLRLREQMFPGGDSMHHWPKLGLNTLRWAKRQGALCGPAHSGWGLEVETAELPNLTVPPFNGIGANEYIVDVTHEVPGPDGGPVPAVDFLSTVDTPHVWELNIWYHTLNAGFRTRISGETDFPCIYGERVGLGRSYVRLPKAWSYEDWCEGIRAGRNYVGDGLSHLWDFAAEGGGSRVAMGEAGSELKVSAGGGPVRFTARVAARLEERPVESIRRRKYSEQPYWHLARARLGDTRTVPVELIANGQVVARTNLVADGTVRAVGFAVPVEQSGWYALRILPSSHTNPIFVVADGRPIRSSRRSVQWCLDGVERCWGQKERFYQGAERRQAEEAFQHAREVYRKRLAECLRD